MARLDPAVEGAWHKIYLGLQSVLGQLKVQQQAEKGVAGSLFGRTNSSLFPWDDWDDGIRSVLMLTTSDRASLKSRRAPPRQRMHPCEPAPVHIALVNHNAWQLSDEIRHARVVIERRVMT